MGFFLVLGWLLVCELLLLVLFKVFEVVIRWSVELCEWVLWMIFFFGGGMGCLCCDVDIECIEFLFIGVGGMFFGVFGLVLIFDICGKFGMFKLL